MTTRPDPQESNTRVRLAGASRAGQVRTVNQDTYFAGTVGGRTLALVADGMGGHQTGEVASERTADAIRRELAASRAHPPVALARAIQVANREVLDHARSDPRHEGMGTTLTAVLVDDQVALIAHVGDSRAYLLRDGELRLLTEDHSWVAERVKQGILTEDEARKHRWRNVITNALGATARFRLDLAHFELRSGDRLLLASDGVTALLSRPVLQELLAEGDPEDVATRLLDATDERGSPDNVTAVALVVDDVAWTPKRYDLPEAVPWTVDVGETMTGVREVENRFPGRGPMRWLRNRAWYPYRLWILGSAYLVLLLIVFVFLR